MDRSVAGMATVIALAVTIAFLFSDIPAVVSVTILGTSAFAIGSIWILTRDAQWAPIMLLALLVRFPYLTTAPIHDDSSVYFEHTTAFLAGAPVPVEHLGVFGVSAPFVALFGPFGMNLASLTASLLTVPLVGMAAASAFETWKHGHAAAVVMAIFPIHVYYSSWAYTEPISLFFFSLALFLVLEERYGLGAVTVAILLITRLEFAIFILIPFAIVNRSNRRVLQRLVGYGPFAGILVLGVAGLLWLPDNPNQLGRYTAQLPLAVSKVWLVEYLVHPLEHAVERVSFYLPHFIHWGVPYFELELVNPILPLLFVVGVGVRFADRTPGVAKWLVGLFGATIFVFGAREVVAGNVSSSFLAVTLLPIVISGGYLLRELIRSSTPESDLLLATAPYIALLSISFIGTRYLLPLGVVYTIFAGYGLSVSVDRFRRIYHGEESFGDIFTSGSSQPIRKSLR